MKRLLILVFFVSILCFAQTINAQICTLTASGATYTIPAASHYDATQTSNLTGVGTGDYMFEDGWWFRVSGDTQEFFFPAPSTTTCAGANGTITWTDVNGRGLFSATNTLNLTSTVANTGLLTLTMSITNLTGSPLVISLFHGADFDVNGTAGTDSATLLTANNHIRITDSTAGFAEYRAFNPAANAFLVRPFAATTDVFGLLGNTAVNNFDNSGLPATNFDFTGAFQWDLNIPANGTASVSVILSGNSALTSAAGVSISGYVASSRGTAIPSTIMTLTGSDGVTRSARTNSFGYYNFDNVRVGETYILNASRKGYVFAPQVVSVSDHISELNFIANE